MKLSLLEWITIALMGFGIYHIVQLYWVDLPAFLARERVYAIEYDSIGIVHLSSSTSRRAYGRHPQETTWIGMPVGYIGDALRIKDMKQLEAQIQAEGIVIDTYITKGGDSILVPGLDEELFRKSVKGLSVNYSLSFLPFIIFFGIRLIMMAWRRLLNRY